MQSNVEYVADEESVRESKEENMEDRILNQMS